VCVCVCVWAGTAQSVQLLATGWTVRGSSPGGGEIFRTHPASCTIGTATFPGLKRPRRGVYHPPHLAPRLKKERSCTTTPPLGFRVLFYGKLYSSLYIYVYIYIYTSAEVKIGSKVCCASRRKGSGALSRTVSNDTSQSSTALKSTMLFLISTGTKFGRLTCTYVSTYKWPMLTSACSGSVLHSAWSVLTRVAGCGRNSQDNGLARWYVLTSFFPSVSLRLKSLEAALNEQNKEPAISTRWLSLRFWPYRLPRPHMTVREPGHV
jgi:hypothetical protein